MYLQLLFDVMKIIEGENQYSAMAEAWQHCLVPSLENGNLFRAICQADEQYGQVDRYEGN